MVTWARHRRHDLPGELVAFTNAHLGPGFRWYTIRANRWYGKAYRLLGCHYDVVHPDK